MADKNHKVKIADYGAWSSPITAEVVIAEGGLSKSRFSFLQTCLNDNNEEVVFWTELRPNEKGRIVVCSWSEKHKEIVSWTPEGFNARTTVHEYGGGSCFISKGNVYFSNFSDQKMYMQQSSSSPPLQVSSGGKGLRYADGEMCPFSNTIICVREDHGIIEDQGAKEACNTIVSIDPEAKEEFVLVKGEDFYSSPRTSSTGMLAWVQWSHPNMPWDTTGLYIAQLSTNGKSIEGPSQQISYNESVSIMYPRWSADDSLYFISDRSDWWNVYEYIFSTNDERNIFPVDKEIGLPQWRFGLCSYVPHPKNPKLFAVVCGGELGIVNAEVEKMEVVNTGFVSHIYPYFSANGQKLYCVAGSTIKSYVILEVDMDTKKVVIIKDVTKSFQLDEGYISIPKAITFPTEDNKVSHGYLYLPKNKDYAAPTGSLPPLLVKVHGGPTSSTSPVFDLNKQFFTSRGIAVLDMNYRGSTGYGMHYRKELYGNWGKVDVEDCCNGALYVAETMKVADRNKLCIDGGSAGGYTSLACLTLRPEVFQAGASMYGVSDVEALVKDTHKFESRYMDTIVGPYPESIELYKERSPISHVNRLKCPMIFFQGDEDKIVLPNQAEMMFNAIKEKGIACCYVLYKGEQHGFRKSENIIATLEGEFCFFAKVFGYEPADFECKLDIKNMDSLHR